VTLSSIEPPLAPSPCFSDLQVIDLALSLNVFLCDCFCIWTNALSVRACENPTSGLRVPDSNLFRLHVCMSVYIVRVSLPVTSVLAEADKDHRSSHVECRSMVRLKSNGYLHNGGNTNDGIVKTIHFRAKADEEPDRPLTRH
jgi:hypothetical protein